MQPSDAELMARVRAGDRDAFGSLVDRHKDPLVNFLTRLTGCRERGEEIAQESFLRLFRSASRYVEQGKLAAYLYRIGANLVRQQDRNARRRRLLAHLLQADNGGPPRGVPGRREAAPLVELERQELRRKLLEALVQIPVKYRVPLVLHELEGLSYLAVAQATRCREGTVKSRIYRGREQLRRLLEPYWRRGESSERRSLVR